MFEWRDNYYVAIPGLEYPGRHRIPGVQAGAGRLDRAFAETERLYSCLVVVEIGIEQRQIQILPASGSLAIEQGGADRAHRVCPGTHVPDSRHNHIWRALGLAAHRNNSRVRRAEVIKARLVGERPILPECRNRTHYDFRIQLLHRVVIEAESADHSGREILDHYVRLANQLLDYRKTFGRLEIDAKAFLAAIVLHEIAPAPVDQALGPARRSARWRHLDLDHAGAHFGQHQSAGGARHDLREVEDLVAVQHVSRSIVGHDHL